MRTTYARGRAQSVARRIASFVALLVILAGAVAEIGIVDWQFLADLAGPPGVGSSSTRNSGCG